MWFIIVIHANSNYKEATLCQRSQQSLNSLAEPHNQFVRIPQGISQKPVNRFTRNNGLLPVRKLLHIILGMRKDTISTELREYFGAVSNAIPTASAFVQQRGKLLHRH